MSAFTQILICLTRLRIELLQRVVKIATPVDSYKLGEAFPIFCQPLDLKIFTFERQQRKYPEPITPFLGMLLGDLSRMLYLAMECASHFSSAIQRCYLEHCATIHRGLMAIRPSIAGDMDARLKATLHTALLFSWSSLASNDADLTYRFDSLTVLQASLRQPDIDQCWADLPGALIWCLVIGARLAHLDSARKWFMVQLVRVTSCMALDYFDEVLQSLRLVIGGLDAAEMLRQSL